MNKKLLLGLILAFLLRGPLAQAQDPVFSQFFASPLQLNSAFAGSAQAPFIALNYRMQFPSFNNNGAAYSTIAASYDQDIKGLNSGFGLSLMTDDAGQGIYKKTYANVVYSYKIAVNNKINTRFGVEAGFIQSNLDWSRLVFQDQIEVSTGNVSNATQEARPLETKRTVFDISTGVLVYGAGFHAGLSIKHLAKPDDDFIKANQSLRIGLPTRWTLHGGYEIITKKGNRYRPDNFITPTLLYVKQGDFNQVVVGAYGGFGPIIGGLWYRHTLSNPESLITMIGFKTDYFKAAYSFDYTVSALASKSGGTHEVSLIFNLDPFAAKKVDILDCFRMFR